MELIEDRHGKGALIITSQVPVSKWYDVIGEQTIADAILDRIVHNAHRLELQGESMRKRRKLRKSEPIKGRSGRGAGIKGACRRHLTGSDIFY